MRVLACAVVGSGLLAVATPARAQAPAAVPVDDVTPAFALMDVDGDHSQLEVEAGMGLATGNRSGQLWTGRLRAQVMINPSFGLYTTLQGGAVTGGGDGDFGFSNPELGGVFHTRPSATTDISLHVGAVVSLSDGDSLGQLAGTALRPSDLPLAAAGTSWLRAGASATYHEHAVFARVDLGIDQQLDSGDDDETLEHLNLGLGFGNQRWSATVELQALFANGEHTETAGLSLHYRGASASPYVTIAAPLGEDLFHDMLLLSAGASFAL